MNTLTRSITPCWRTIRIIRSPIIGAVRGRSRREALTQLDLPHQRYMASALSQEAMPSNLRFDHRSSFAPQEEMSLKLSAEFGGDNGDGIAEESVVESSQSNLVETKDLEIVEPLYVVPLPDRLKTTIFHGDDGSEVGSLWLESSVFGVDPIRVDLIKQSVDYVRNKIRGRRKAKSKTISEVSGSGRKVRQQKGTGSARAGHSRPAHWRGGAKAHGPKNTVDYGDVKMNKKTKRLAMVSILSQKLKEGNLIVIDDLRLDSHKTAPWAQLLEDTFGVGKDAASALIVDHYYEEESTQHDSSSHASFNGVPINLWVASGNVANVKVVNLRFVNVFDILKKDKLILTLEALKQIESTWAT